MSENSSNYNCSSGTLNLCGYLFMVYLLNVGYYETMSFFNNNYSNVNDDDKNKMLFLCGVMLFFSLCMLPIAYSTFKNKDNLNGIPILIIYATMIALIYNIGSTIFNFIIIKNNKEITPFQQNMIEVSISLFFATIILLLLVTLKINDYVIDDRNIEDYLNFKSNLYTQEENALQKYLTNNQDKSNI